MIDPLSALFVVAGIVYLVLGGDLLVRGSIPVARRWGMSPAAVGATIVAFGTSLPELIVSVLAAKTGHGGLAIGNVVGSNVTNTLLVLGIPALIVPIVGGKEMRVHAAFMLIVSGLFALLCFMGPFKVWHGATLLGVMAVAMLVSVKGHISLVALSDDEEEFERALGLPHKPAMAWFFIAFGAAVLPLGADLTVRGAVEIAGQLSVDESAVGATVVALGTSLPELSVSVIAAMHRQIDMAIGNVVGSNTFNILFVIGVTAVVTDVPVPDRVLGFGLWYMLACTAVLTALIFAGKRIGRPLAIGFLAAYVAFVWLEF